MEQKCNHCNHQWDYQGIREYVTTCPNCQWKVYLNWSEEQLELIRELKKLKKEKESVQDNNQEGI